MADDHKDYTAMWADVTPGTGGVSNPLACFEPRQTLEEAISAAKRGKEKGRRVIVALIVYDTDKDK